MRSRFLAMAILGLMAWSSGCDDTRYRGAASAEPEAAEPEQTPDELEPEAEPEDEPEPDFLPPPLIGCATMDAKRMKCAPFVCDEADLWYWDGAACVLIPCACEGEECGLGHLEEEDCLAERRGCDGELCRATGGSWLHTPPYAQCGHSVCGHPPPEDCFTPVEGCDCGPGSTFEPGLGCREDPSCDRDDLCLATGGQVAFCDTYCGFETGMICEGGGCDCGPTQRFDDLRGCVADCPERVDLCEFTGGTMAQNCGDFNCGQPSDDDCDGIACDCGRRANFVPGAGCVADDACLLGLLGDPCGFNSNSRDSCSSGLVCCDGLQGQTCIPSVCDRDRDPVTGCPALD